jgi:hypothetical protein
MNRTRVLFGAAMCIAAAACSGADSVGAPLIDTDVAAVRVTVNAPPPPGNGFVYPNDTVNVVAALVDERGDSIVGRAVQWSLQLPDGKLVGDSIATITATGGNSARIVFVRSALVVVVASVARKDGAVKTGTIFLQWSPELTAKRIVAEGETEFTVAAGTTIQSGPAVRVLDGNQQPVAGVPVSFGPTPHKVVITNSDGVARFGPWQVDTVAREYFLDATVVVSTQQELMVGFYAHVTPGPLAHFTVLGGNNQSGVPAATLPDELHVRATDSYNNPLHGLTVTFSVVSGGGGNTVLDRHDRFVGRCNRGTVDARQREPAARQGSGRRPGDVIRRHVL